MRYEDFAHDPEPSMRSLCDWLEIGFEPAMTRPTMMGVPWSNNSSFTEGPAGIDSMPERRIVLSPEERGYLLSELKPFRERFGYQDAGCSSTRGKPLH
jgi:hypothetical protein